MPQALVCRNCTEPFVFTGAGIELVGESRIGYRHRCGAMNELQYVSEDETGRAIYRIVGVVRAAHAFAAQKDSLPPASNTATAALFEAARL
jgi:hypothetical protein